MTDDEGYPPDYETMPESHDYVIERMHDIAIVYTKYGRTVHIWNKGTFSVYCHMDTWLDWLGTGSMQEIEQAHRMPVCKRCLKVAGQKELQREEQARV